MKIKVCITHLLLTLAMLTAAVGVHAGVDRHIDRTMLTVKNLNTADGLSNARAYSIVETADGAIWIGTKNGIDRYNGQWVKNFEMAGANRFSNAADRIYKLIATAQNTLYAYDNKGNIYTYDATQHKFSLVYNLRNSIGSDIIVNEIIVGSDDALWIATNRGLYRLATDGKGVWIKRDIFAQHVAQYGSKLLVGTTRGLCFYDMKQRKAELIESKYSVLASYYDTTSRQLWLGTFNNGIKTYDFRSHSIAEKAPAEVAHLPVRVFKPWTSDRLLIGVDGAGVYAFDLNTRTTSLLLNTNGKANEALRGEGIYDICVDSQQNLWIASYTGGVDVVELTAGRLSFVQNEYLNPQSILSNNVNAVCQTPDGTLWYATDKGVSIYNPTTKTWRQALRDRVVLTLCYTKDGRMYAGTYGSGVFVVTADGTSRPAYTLEGGQLKTNYVFSIYADADGGLWIGCLNGDLVHICNNVSTYIAIREVQCIVGSPDGRYVTIGTSHGGYLVNRKTHRVTRVFYPTEFKNCDYNYFINTLIYTDANHLLIGTDGGGIYKYDLRKHTVTNTSTEQGLPSNSVKALVKDAGCIWLSTDRGLAVLNNDKIINVNVANGLEREYRRMSAALTSNGNIIFGSVEGAVILNRNFALGLKYKAALRLTDINIEGWKNDSASVVELSRMMSEGCLNLSYNYNTFTIDFECINHKYQRDIQYTCLLEGYDRQWSTLTSYQKARFVNLPPGNYVLHVKSVSRSNGRVLDEQDLRIHIAEPWWNSWFAWLVYIAIIAAILRFAWQYYQERLQQHYNNEKIRFFVNTAHNIRTPLSLVLAPLTDIAAADELKSKTRGYVDMAIRNGDKLMSMVTELLDFEKSSDRTTNVNLREVDIATYLRAQAEKFRLVAAGKNIALSTSTALSDGESAAPSANVFTAKTDIALLDVIFENLVSNAVKYTPTGGTVTFAARSAGKFVEILVSDTGIGIPKAEHSRIFNNFFRASNAVDSGEMGSGLGLSLTQQLAKRLKGSLRFESEEGKGTTFILALPATELSNEGRQKVVSTPTPTASTAITTEEDAPEQSNTVATAKETVLFVDDNEDLRQYVSMAFSDKYKVVAVASGEDGWAYLKDELCDIVVSDVMMPGISGEELCHRIKECPDLSWLPVILLTARAAREYQIEGLQLGADDFVAKPFDSAVLASKIDSMLTNRRRLADYYMKRSLSIVAEDSNSDTNDELSRTTSEPSEDTTHDNEPSDATIYNNVEQESAEETPQLNAADAEFVDNATRIVLENIANTDFTIDTLCREMAMSRTLFYGRLKTLTGKSPQDFIRILRLEQAAKFLRHGDSVLDVSVKTGFVNTKYFSTVFKKHFGVSPSKFE